MSAARAAHGLRRAFDEASQRQRRREACAVVAGLIVTHAAILVSLYVLSHWLK